MAVTFSTSASATAATSTNILIGITVGGTNAALVAMAGIDRGISGANITATVTSVSWSQGSGTTALVTSFADAAANHTYGAIWQIPAPTAGAGNVRIGFSSSVAFQAHIDLYTGADQTTPCPAGNSVASNQSSNANFVMQPSSVGASDLSAGCAFNTSLGTPVSTSPNQTWINTGTSINATAGWGSTSVTMTFDQAENIFVAVATRVVAAAAGGGASAPPFFIGDLSGIGSGGRFFKDPLQ